VNVLSEAKQQRLMDAEIRRKYWQVAGALREAPENVMSSRSNKTWKEVEIVSSYGSKEGAREAETYQNHAHGASSLHM
jgi:hypothetical protein